MVVKRITKGRKNTAQRIAYATDTERARDIPNRPEGDPLQGLGKKIAAAGALNGASEDLRDVGQEIRELSDAYRGPGRPTEHFMISWREGEDQYPTPEQMRAAVQEVLDKTGLGDKPAVWACHNDTDHRHVHVIVSRLDLDDRGRLHIPEGRAYVTTSRGHNNIVESLHVAAAVLCRDYGWAAETRARYDDNLQRRPTPPRPADGLKLPLRVRDYEALHGHQHPAHVMALAAAPILAAAQSRAEAVAGLAAAGITMEIKAAKPGGREGAVLRTPLGARLRLSALPASCSLKSLDARARDALAGQPAAAKASPPRINGREAVKLAQPRRTPAPWTASRVKNQARKIVANAGDWDGVLREFQANGWTLARAGKSGALIVAPGATENDPKIRVKLSDVGRGTSYGKISEKLGLSVEEAVEDGTLKQELFEAVVSYPESAQKQVQATAEMTTENAPTDPNAITLPQSVLDDEALTGQPSALRRLGEVARDTIRESLQNDKSISQTIERLAEKGIQIELFQKDGIGLVSLRLSAIGVKGSLSLGSLPADCRLKAIAAKFGEKYRETPDRKHYNPEAAKAAELVEIDPEDDVIEIIRKNLAKIASQNAHGTKIFDWSRDTRKLKKVEAQKADESAALDISAPEGLQGAEKDLWKAGELVKHEFKSALAAYNKQTEENNGTRTMWDFVIPALEKRGWSLEMTETGAQVRIDKKTTIDLADLELKFTAYCRLFGEPDVKFVKDGLSKAELEELKSQVQFDRFAQFAAIDVGNLFKSGDFDSIMNEIEQRGWRIEAVGNSAQIVINEHLTVPLWRAGVDYEELCEKWGREPDFPISGWREMTEQQQRYELQKRQLRQIFRAKTWQSVIERLELQGARLELTKNGEGGRIVLPNGHKIKISEFTKSLKVLKQKKQGDLDRLVAVRKAAEKTQKAIQQQISKSEKEAKKKKVAQNTQPFKMPETDPYRLALARLEEENKKRAEERPLDKPLSKKEINFLNEQHEAMEMVERQHLEQQQQHEANYDSRTDHGTD